MTRVRNWPGVRRGPAVEDQADLSGTADIEVLADDLLEEDTPQNRLIEHLGKRELGFADEPRALGRVLAYPVLDQPVLGRIFFEEVIRENLDIGRPAQVSLIFDRRSLAARPASSHPRHHRGRRAFAARRLQEEPYQAIPQGGASSSNRDHHQRHPRLRRRPTHHNLPNCARSALPPTDVCSTSNASVTTCFIGEASFQDLQQPITVDNQRAAALRFADPRVQSLLNVLLLFLLVAGTSPTRMFASTRHAARHKPSQYTPGRITYDLRRLRLHGLIERIPKTHRYRATAKGLRTAIFYTRLYNRALRTGLASSRLPRATDLPVAKSMRAAEALSTIATSMQNSQPET